MTIEKLRKFLGDKLTHEEFVTVNQLLREVDPDMNVDNIYYGLMGRTWTCEQYHKLKLTLDRGHILCKKCNVRQK